MSALSFRPASAEDVDFIVSLIVTDFVGPLPATMKPVGDDSYRRAYEAVAADPNQELVIATLDGERIGCLQLTFIPGLGLTGAWRGLVENVHIVPEQRSQGFGSRMMDYAIARCRERGCYVVQLTSNKARVDAHRFYRRLGFAQSHEGFKLAL